MATRYPQELRDDVVHVAINRELGVKISQIAKDFGIHAGILDKWLSRARSSEANSLASPMPRTTYSGSYAAGTNTSSSKSRCCAMRHRTGHTT